MTDFNADLWRDRAWRRLKRAHSAGSPKSKLESDWARDVVAIWDLDKLVTWCNRRCLKVTFIKKASATYYPDMKTIKIASRLSPVRQLAFLLHECGHHLIGTKEHNGRYSMGYPQTDPALKRTFHHRLTCLEEEMEAWHRGWRLAKRLKLSIRRDVFDEIRLECLRTYVKWTLRPGKEDKDDSEGT